MATLHTFSDIEAVLARYIPLAKEMTGKDITLERMRPLMAVLGNPEKKLNVIHIAGTSGKTSTTYYIAALLTATGKKVGMTVSPHVDIIGERIQINMQPLGAEEFSAALEEFLGIIDQAHAIPTYFELLIALVYWYFAKIGVDYAVIETGLGGLQDSTNVADEPSKICVITDIGYDHMHVLGNTISEIATQKAGIIHEQNTVYMYQQAAEVMTPVLHRCMDKRAQLYTVNDSFANEPEDLSELAVFQQRNWHLAHVVFNAIKTRDGLQELSLEMIGQSLHIQVPGRMEQRQIFGKTIIMDGAHNGQKMKAFVDSFKKRWPGKKAAVLLSLKSSKDYTEVLPLLKDIASTVIVTTFFGIQDRLVESIDPDELAISAMAYGIEHVVAKHDQEAAYKMLLEQDHEVLIITGSFYLIGQLRQHHSELSNA